MWQPCFGKNIIMYIYVGVYILVLIYNSSSMCYFGNIVEIKRNLNEKKIYLFLEIMFFQWNGCKLSIDVLI